MYRHIDGDEFLVYKFWNVHEKYFSSITFVVGIIYWNINRCKLSFKNFYLSFIFFFIRELNFIVCKKMYILVFLCFVLFFYALIYFSKLRKIYKFASNLPGPKGIPIFGVALEFNAVNREGVFSQKNVKVKHFINNIYFLFKYSIARKMQ